MGINIIAWMKENKDRLLLFLGVILVGVLAFEAGMLQGSLRQVAPLTLSIPQNTELISAGEGQIDIPPSPGSSGKGIEPVVVVVGSSKDCPFVGSKNSDKFHLPTCAAAKRIKPENRVCFASQEIAKSRGYVAGCLK